METSKAIAIIYESALETTGSQVEARDAVSDTLLIFIASLQDNGLPVTEEAIRIHLAEEARFCLKCLKKDVA